jgi:GNAT superfamily N-acetyltransferase
MNNNEYYILPATNEDIPLIKNVVFTALREYGLVPDEFGKDNDLNDIKKNYFDANGFFGVLIQNETNEIVGTFGITFFETGVCQLRKMYLTKRMRGKGLGKLMMETAIATAKKKNYKKIILETVSPLKEAIALYKKFGFTEFTPEIINKRVDQAFELYI